MLPGSTSRSPTRPLIGAVMMPAPREKDDLGRAVSQARGARPNVIAIRVWEQAGDRLIESAASTDSAPAQEIPEEVRTMARGAAGSGKIAALRDYTLQEQTLSDINLEAEMSGIDLLRRLRDS
jgi:hypothetical protein